MASRLYDIAESQTLALVKWSTYTSALLDSSCCLTFVGTLIWMWKIVDVNVD